MGNAQAARSSPPDNNTSTRRRVHSQPTESAQSWSISRARPRVCRSKIAVLGANNSGKTSFCKSIATMGHGYCDAQASALWNMVPSLERTDNRSVAIGHFRHIFRRNYNTYELTMWDFAGQDVYQPVHAMFFTRRTIYIVCIDMYSYGVAFEQATLFADDDSHVDRFMDEVVDKKILKWIRLVIARQPDAEFVWKCLNQVNLIDLI